MDETSKNYKEYAKERDRIFQKEYRETANCKKWLLENIIKKPISTMRLFNPISQLEYEFAINKIKVITITFTISRNSVQCIYAFLYMELTDSGPIPKFICIGPSLQSQDGEYRSPVVVWDHFLEITAKLANIMNLARQLFAPIIESGEINFTYEFFKPDGTSVDIVGQVENIINREDILLLSFIVGWIINYGHIVDGMEQNHLNDIYKFAISSEGGKRIIQMIYKFAGETIGKTWGVNVNLLEKAFNGECKDLPICSTYPLLCGQKIIPATVNEVSNIGDIRFGCWREIYVAITCTNLVMNMQTQSLPAIGNWFLIHNATPELFDNLQMKERFVHSSVAASITSQLLAADKQTNINKDPARGSMSDKLGKLSKLMKKSIVYSENNVRLSKYAICMLGENVGRTFGDMRTFTQGHTDPTDVESFFNEENMRRTIFEIIFAFYCMNLQSLIHGDPHINNATIIDRYHDEYIQNTKGRGIPTMVYIVENNYFCFGASHFWACIIDFSRAFLGDYEKIATDFSEQIAHQTFKDQKLRILQTLHYHFPEFTTENREKLEGLIATKFDDVFHVLSAIDPYIFTKGLWTWFTEHNEFNKNVEVTELLCDIYNRAEHLLMNGLEDLLKTGSGPGGQLPNLIIINEFFSDHIRNESEYYKGRAIVDIQNSNNPIKYLITDPTRWNAPLSNDLFMRLRKKYNLFIGDLVKMAADAANAAKLPPPIPSAIMSYDFSESW
jgi:hypothetical protein